MMRFEPADKPAGFSEAVEAPGAAWLAEHPEGRPPALWRRFKPELADAFRTLCAYTVMYEPVGTADHFVSCSEDRSRAYEWSNYRFASAWISASRGNVASTAVLDPFDVVDGWFEILLPSLQLVATDQVPAEFHERATFVLKRLHLRDDERVLRQRREWYRMYQDGELTIEGLRKKAPLIAAAVVKQQRNGT